MDKTWKKNNNRSLKDNNNPSFSSTLLDEIYRSIDQGQEQQEEEELILYRETMRRNQISTTYAVHKNGRAAFVDDDDDEAIASLQRRACMIERWMEKKVSEKVVLRRKSVVDNFERKSRSSEPPRGGSLFQNSCSSSSDSSCGGGFSSSEAESVHGASACRPKPIRTGGGSLQPADKFGRFENYHHQEKRYVSEQKPKHEGGFLKTKTRALKIYGDLKKVKQPISPGGKLSSFLNSLFAAGNAKKAKISSADDMNSDRKGHSKSAHASTCSSASSFSRSCLSKTPSSRVKSSNGAKRSVRFCPVSVIVDEDLQPCGHKSLYNDEQSVEAAKTNDELQFQIMEKHRRVEEAARDLLRNYQRKVECEFGTRIVPKKSINDELSDEDEDDDDAASYASSDLFELDNLSAIGIDRYHEELPVYETTRIDTNRAIANGSLL